MTKLRVIAHLALAICAAWQVGACAGPLGLGTTASGRTVTKDMDLGNFTAIEAQNAFQVDVKPGDAYKVTVTADDNLWNQLDVRTNGQTLVLALKPGSYNNAHLQAQVTMPSVSGVTLSGASRATVAGFGKGASGLAVRCSGASTFDGDVQGGNLTVDLSGASQVTLRGAAASAQITGSGASTAALGALQLEKANVQLSGASNASIKVTSNLDYDLSGASHLSYSGSPAIGKSQTSGGSSAAHQ